MATSGSITGICTGSLPLYRFLVEWTQNSIDRELSVSNITLTCSVQRTSSQVYAYNYIKKPSVTMEVGGQTVKPTINYIDTRNGKKSVFATWTGNVKHDADGSLSLPVDVSFIQYETSSLTGGSASGTVDLDRIFLSTVPVLTPSSVTVGETVTITLKAASKDYAHDIRWEYGANSGIIAEAITGTTVQWEIPESIIDVCTDSKTPSLGIFVTTYNATETVGEEKASLVVDLSGREDLLPTASISAFPRSLLPDAFSGLFIKGKTTAVATISGQGERGASIKSYALSTYFEFNNAVTIGMPNSSPVWTHALTVAGKGRLDGTVYDSRGFYQTASVEIQVLDYTPPRVRPYGSDVAISLMRCDSDGTINNGGTWLRLSAAVSFSPVSGKNMAAMSLRYKKKGLDDTYYSAEIPLFSLGEATDFEGVVPSATFERGSAYTVQLIAEDLIGERTTLDATLGVGSCTIHEGRGGRNLGLGGFCDYSTHDVIDQWWPTREHDGVSNIPPTVNGTGTTDAAINNELATYEASLSHEGFYHFLYTPVTSHSLFGLFPFVVEGFKNSKGRSYQRVTVGTAYSTTTYSRARYLQNATWNSWHVVGGASSVVEESTSGIWQIRKWSGGRCELWARVLVSDAVTTAWGNMYQGNNVVGALAFPVTFAEVPFVSVTCSRDSDSVGSALLIPNNTTQSTTTAQVGNYNLVSATKITAAKVYINYYVVGTI